VATTAPTIDARTDDDAADSDAAAAVDGTWARPIVIAAVPATITGDTTGAPERRAERYDCAATIDERGPEVVYRLDLAAPTVVSLAVTSTVPGVDVDLHVLRAAATAATASDCLTRDDAALVVDLAAGSWWIAVDTYSDDARAGAYTLTLDAPRSTACLTNPIPDVPDRRRPRRQRRADAEPPGLGGCPAGMAPAGRGVRIDRWEAALVTLDGRGVPPYKSPGTAAVVAVSAPGLVPQGYINQTQATAACAAARQAAVHRHRVAARVPGRRRQHLSLRRDPHARRVQRRPHLPPGGAVLRVERQLGVLDDRPQPASISCPTASPAPAPTPAASRPTASST
jgi:hypothetical protein